VRNLGTMRVVYSSFRAYSAVALLCRHSSRVVAFLQAVARPTFRGPRSASIARSQVRLGLLVYWVNDSESSDAGSPGLSQIKAH